MRKHMAERYLVEDMIVTFGLRLKHQSRSFQEVGSYPCTDNFCLIIKQNLLRLVKEAESSTSMYFPNREELSFLVVFALPKASMMGLVAKICSSVWLIPPGVVPTFRRFGFFGSSTVAKYLIMYFALTVFPAPDSPLTTIV